jgi:hypothetical protein
MTALDRIRKLDQEKARIMGEAKGEAMRKAQVALDELNALGFNYRLTEGGRRGGEGSRRGTRQVNPNRPCPVCGFRTEPPHDARAHRTQGSNKRAFTAEELSARGLRKA